MKGALPVGVLGAAGGALGYVLRVRRSGILSPSEGARWKRYLKLPFSRDGFGQQRATLTMGLR
jgi:hypothetical protein